MRTLYEIIEAAKDNEPVTPDETRYAMLVLVGLTNLATKNVSDVADVKASNTEVAARIQRMYADEAHHRYRQALKVDPKQYLGDDVPDNLAYQQFRVIGKRLVDKALAGELPTQQGKRNG